MIRKERMRAVNIQIWTFFLLLIISGCGGEGSTDQKILDPEVVSFAGRWEMKEDGKDCNGNFTQETEMVILQNGTRASLAFSFTNDLIDCSVVDTDLQCRGRLTHANGDVLEITEATFWFEANRRLVGETFWKRFVGGNSACEGSSSFSPLSSNETDTDTDSGTDTSSETDTDTASSTETDTDTDTGNDVDLPYAGIWSIRQYIMGCSEYRQEDMVTYVIEIVDNGENYSIIPIGTAHEALEYTCTLESERLVCTGFVIDRNRTRYEYPGYILSFDGQNHSRLLGTANWTAYLDNHDDALCSGTSEIIATRVVEDEVPDTQP